METFFIVVIDDTFQILLLFSLYLCKVVLECLICLKRSQYSQFIDLLGVMASWGRGGVLNTELVDEIHVACLRFQSSVVLLFYPS